MHPHLSRRALAALVVPALVVLLVTSGYVDNGVYFPGTNEGDMNVYAVDHPDIEGPPPDAPIYNFSAVTVNGSVESALDEARRSGAGHAELDGVEMLFLRQLLPSDESTLPGTTFVRYRGELFRVDLWTEL